MLDIKFIVEHKDVIKMGAKKKHVDVDVDRLVELDARRVEAQKNKDEASLPEIMKEWRSLMLAIPNIPDISVPEGKPGDDNLEVRVWGEETKRDFELKGHVPLMAELNMLDQARGAKISRLQGYFLKNDGVRLALALWQHAQQFFLGKGLTPIMAPAIVRREVFMGTGHLPQNESQIYAADGMCFANAPEIAAMGYHMSEILEKKDLPIGFLSLGSHVARKEGQGDGSVFSLDDATAALDGEQVVLCEASHQTSMQQHEVLVENLELFLQSLGMPYRVVVLCAGNTGVGAVKEYGIELWDISTKMYRPCGTAAYFHDFQTRRLNIRYKDEQGVLRFAHSLHGTAIPTLRILVALVENFQNADGSITIPEVLRSFMGKDVIQKDH